MHNTNNLVAFFKTITHHIARDGCVNFEEDVDVYDGGYFVRVFRQVPGSMDSDEVCYSTQIRIDGQAVVNSKKPRFVVTITSRKSLESDLNEIEEVETHSPHVYAFAETVLDDVSRKTLKALHKFFIDTVFRSEIINLVRLAPHTEPTEAGSGADGDKDEGETEDDNISYEAIALVRRFLGELPGPRAVDTSDISYGSDDEIYLVQRRTHGAETIVYTTNVWFEDRAMHMKTWRAFDVVYAECSHEKDRLNDSFVYNRTTVNASYPSYAFVVGYTKSRRVAMH